jgi:hypothetical protein
MFTLLEWFVGLQTSVAKGSLPMGRIEVVDVADLPASKAPNWPHAHRVCLRIQGADTSGDSERDFFLCSEEPLTDWLLWIKVCQGVPRSALSYRFWFLVTIACAKRIGAAASMERSPPGTTRAAAPVLCARAHWE